MARPKFRGVLLCEDKEHERFFRRLLRKWFGRRLTVRRIPNNQGAGDKYVVANYVREVRVARSRRSENYSLVVVVDGDRFKAHKRLLQFDQQLADAKLPKRGEAEKILVFVPTRNIETWELWLCGRRDLDEDGDFKSRFQRDERSGAASVKEAVGVWFRQLDKKDVQIEERALPSLSMGRREVRRLDGAGK